MIPNWRSAWRMFSMHIAAGQAVAAIYTQNWPMLVFAFLFIAARLIDQPSVREVQRGI